MTIGFRSLARTHSRGSSRRIVAGPLPAFRKPIVRQRRKAFLLRHFLPTGKISLDFLSYPRVR
jgi:hypothetical protein